MPDIVVIENPQIYPHSKARPSNILQLARVVGRYEERFKGARQKLVSPHEWKGSINGDIFTARICAAMTPAERQLLRSISDGVVHNAIDAVGLGKWAFRQPWMRPT